MAAEGVSGLVQRLASVGRAVAARKGRRADAPWIAIARTAQSVATLAQERYAQLGPEERAFADRVVSLSGAAPMMGSVTGAVRRSALAAGDVADTMLKSADLLRRVLHLEHAPDFGALIEWLAQLARTPPVRPSSGSTPERARRARRLN